MKKKMMRFLQFMALCFMILFSGKIAAGTVWASEGVLPGFPNLDYTFTTVDEGSVSTTSEEGQVTVIVFGKTDCGNSQATVRNIATSSWVGSEDIRVIFAECQQADAQATAAFAKTYGSEDIIFCYDLLMSIGPIYNAMWEYHDMFYEPSASGSLPFTVLIDGSNQVRKVLKGNQSAASIMSEIEKFSQVEYEKPTVDINIKGTENYEYANEVFNQLNQSRAEKGLPALSLDRDLMETAMQRAAELSMYYSHTRPNGSSCTSASSRGTRKSENIAVGYATPQAVMAAWISSSGHYANIMDTQVTSVGVGCFVDRSGICHWVQFFDNAAPIRAEISGSKEVVRMVSIQKKMLSLQGGADKEFSCKDKGTTINFSISHVNEEFASSNPEIMMSNFDFTSSNLSTAEVSAEGVITVKEPGTAEITASLKEEPSILLKQTISVKGHNYSSHQVVVPTKTEQGYTLHICSVCGGTYKDAFVPKLPAEGGSEREVANVAGLKASSGTDNVKLSWGKVAEASGYYIYQYNSANKRWDKIGTVDASKTSYTVKKLKKAAGYRFAVKAYMRFDGKESNSKSYASVYTATKPGIVSVKATAGKKKAILKWKKVKGATGYTIYYKTSQKAAWKKLKSVKGTSYTKKGLKSGKQYYFTVKAYKTYKGRNYEGSFRVKKVKVK